MQIKTFRITINGWYGHFNGGDDAILKVFVEQSSLRFKCNVVVLSDLPENIKSTDNLQSEYHLKYSIIELIKSLFNGNLFGYFRNLHNSDLFVLGGGGLLRDNTSWKNLFRVLDEIWISKLFKRRVMLYAIGVGPFKSEFGKFLIGSTVKMCDLVTVRDEHSAKLLVDIGVSKDRIHVVADPAFLLEPEVPHDHILTDILSGEVKKIGVFPAQGLVDGGRDFSRAIHLAQALDDLVEKTGLHFVAFPMRVCESEIDDVAISYAIKSAMKYPDAMYVYEKRLTPSELKWVTGKTMLNITVRLHAMIFSLASNVPVVAINYEPKVANVFSAFACPEYLVEMDDIYKSIPLAVMQCINNLPSYSNQISKMMDEYKRSALITFELMQSLNKIK